MESVTQSTMYLLSSTTTASTILSHESRSFFSWYDYAIFGTMLSVSLGIGIYFGFFGKKQVTAKDYLMGGKNMKVIPIVISLIATNSSGITLLAVPADVYVYGAAYVLTFTSLMIGILVVNYIYLPVFYNLQVTSTYEYLGLRFDQRTRKCSSFLFAIAVFVHLPVVILIPALAFSAASGIDVHIATFVVCSICIFYTTVGGIKGLVWGDTVQFSLVFGTISFILYLGIKASGGLATIWENVAATGRLDILDMNFDLTKRGAFWAFFIGFSIHWSAHTAVNQGCNQKYLSVPTLEKAKLVVVLYSVGMAIVKTISVFCGVLLAARYAHCDLFVTKQIQKNDELFPYYVLDVARNHPGVSGLFIAGVFSASLSHLSANLNALSGTIYQDFLKEPLAKKGIKRDSFVLKILVVITGAISTSLVYVIENLGGLLSLAIGLGAVAHGPLLGMFVLGFIFPRANGKGAFFGALTALAFMSVVIFGSNYYRSMKMISYGQQPIYVDSCDFPINATVLEDQIHKLTTSVGDDISPLFRISFYWYTSIGASITVIVGLIISLLTEVPRVPKKLLSPIIHRFLPKNQSDDLDLDYYGIDDALNKLNENELLSEEEKVKELMRKLSRASDALEG